MSSMYLDEGIKSRGSTRSISEAIQQTREWMADVEHRSSTSSQSSDSSRHNDLDLDSLFKRLDKYPAEMNEEEERLKRARSSSEKSDGINIKRFSFEEFRGLGIDKAPSPPKSTRRSNS